MSLQNSVCTHCRTNLPGSRNIKISAWGSPNKNVNISISKSAYVTKQQGFSMIELLVSMLVFAVGLLGIISLQTYSMRMTHDAELMGQASLLVNSMADKLRVQGDQLDIAPWKQQVELALPQGSGTVEKNGQLFTILVDWFESSDSTSDKSSQSHSLSLFL